MVVTKVPSKSVDQNLMHKALTDGNWFVDNNKLSEQLALAQRVSWFYSFCLVYCSNGVIN